MLKVWRQNIAGHCQQTFELPLVNFLTNNLNFHWRWRWWCQIQAIFLNLFYSMNIFIRAHYNWYNYSNILTHIRRKFLSNLNSMAPESFLFTKDCNVGNWVEKLKHEMIKGLIFHKLSKKVLNVLKVKKVLSNLKGIQDKNSVAYFWLTNFSLLLQLISG